MDGTVKITCRLCDKIISGKNGLLLYDYTDNVETRLGRKLSTVLNFSEKNEDLSNYCCECCSSKIEICFGLLVEIRASDEVIQQTYKNSLDKENLDTSTQLFICQECNVTISGIKLFTKHHENHILRKTIAGSKKDIPLSFIESLSTQENKNHNNFEKNYDEAECINEEYNSKFTQVKSSKVGLNNVTDNSCIKSVKSYNDFVYNEGNDENYENDYDCNSISDLNASSEELNDSYYHSIIENSIDITENLSENDNEEDKDITDILKYSELLSYDTDNSDAHSDVSFSSDSSFKNLLEIVKWELEKSDCEDNDLKIERNEDGIYPCWDCNLEFNYKFLLALHLKDNHKSYHEFDINVQKKQLESLETECDEGCDGDVLKKCCFCKKFFQSSELKTHVLECKEQYSSSCKNTLCQICGKMCTFRNLEKHMEEHKKTDGWTCELCGKKFKAKRFLESHLGEHDESKKKICEICGKKLLPLSFFSHITKHRKKRHVCQYCGKAFSYSYGLRIHLKVHDTSKKLESRPEKKKDKVFCWLCKKDFNCTIALNKHLKNDHNAEGVEQDSRFPCSQCDKKFADMFSLKAHLKLIHEMKDEEIARLKSLPVYRYIECNVCNKVFNSENKIRIHMKQDHGLKPFEMEILKKECEKCGKKFASKQNLIHHINGAHLHIKPMTCDICQEKFAKHSSLIYHKLRHSGEKPFQCEFCHKSYRQRNDVIRHLARHVRDKELTLEEASAVNNSPSRLVIKRRIFLKDSSINYRTIFRKNRRKSEVIDMEPILEEEVNEIQEEQMEFNEDGIPDMIYVEEVQVDETQTESPLEVHCMNVKPVYNEERNTIILSNPDVVKNSVKNLSCKYISSQLKHIPAVIVKKQEQIQLP